MGKQRTHSKFKSISDVIEGEKEFEDIRRAAKNYSVVDEFSKIFPEIKSITEAVKVNKSVLYLKVENSVWKSELNLKKNLMVEKINKYFNEKIISTIYN